MAALLAMVTGCAGAPAQIGPTPPRTVVPTGDPGNPTGPPSGAWQGTMTFHATVDDTQHSSSTSGTGVYLSTTTVDSVVTADVTDIYTLTGTDAGDLSFGISSVKLTGAAANQGTTLERNVYVSDKHNALNCHFLDETGTEVMGPWSGTGAARAEIHFAGDGSYDVTARAGGDPVTGEIVNLELPKRLWQTYTILAGAPRDCPPAGTTNLHNTEGPVIQWASSAGDHAALTGQLGAGASVVEGSASYKILSPKGNVTVSWRFAHEGVITLPHD